MTGSNIQHLISLCPAAPASSRLDLGPVFRIGHTPVDSSSPLLNQPDAGWRLARRLAGTTSRTSIVPDDPAYRWVRAAVVLLKAGVSPDTETVNTAIRISRDPHLRPVVEAALVAPDATIGMIAEGLGMEPDLVACYSDLFFNVPDRRQDRSYMHRLVHARSEEDDEIPLRVIAHRTDLATLLSHVGYQPLTCDERGVKGLARDVFARTMATARIELAAGGLNQRQAPPALTHALRILNGFNAHDMEESQGGGDRSILSRAIADILAEDADKVRADYRRMAEDMEMNDRAGQRQEEAE